MPLNTNQLINQSINQSINYFTSSELLLIICKAQFHIDLDLLINLNEGL